MPKASSGRHQTTFTTPSDREVAAVRLFDAPRELVWAAFTDPKHIPHWMLGGPEDSWTMPVCEVDLRPGGRWRYVWRKPDGKHMEMDGTYIEIVAPSRLVYTERWGGDWPEVANTLVLTEEDGKTKSVLTARWPTNAERERALATGMNEGWNQGYANLDELLRTMVEGDAAQNSGS